MQWAGVIIIICWSVFFIYWGFSALNAKKNKGNYSRILIGRGLIALALIFILHLHLFDKQTHIIPNPFLNVLGVLLTIAGISFAVWARRHLGRNWGMPMSVKEKPEMVTSGPYHYVRHPIYTGSLTAILGTLLVAGGYVIIPLIVFCIYFIYSARQEEKLLLKQFPDIYPRYMKKSKMIIPFIF